MASHINYASLLACRKPNDLIWNTMDTYQTGYGCGGICESCGTTKNTFKRQDWYGDCFLLYWCTPCYDFKVRPRMIEGILSDQGPEAAVAWVQRSDREAARIREIKAAWEADFVRRYADLQVALAAPQQSAPPPLRYYQDDWEDEGYCDDGDSSSCGCGACEEHDPSHPGYEGGY